MNNTANTKNWRQYLGLVGEDLACSFVGDNGLIVIERNFRSGRQGELDIIARDEDGLIVFIEVKTRRLDQPVCGFEHTGQLALSKAKQRRMVALALAYLRGPGANCTETVSKKVMRFDLLLVDFVSPAKSLGEYIRADDRKSLETLARITHIPEIF